MAFLEWTFYNNTVRAWLVAALGFALAFVVVNVVRILLQRSLQRIAGRTKTNLDDVVIRAVEGTRWWFAVMIGLWTGSRLLLLPEEFRDTLDHVVVLAVLLQMGVWSRITIRAYVDYYAARKVEHDAASVTTVRALGFLATVAAWSLLVLMALDNLGINVTALVAGLGIGGVAVALAVQNVLGDLFASLSIVLDKPFVYGDFIIVDDMLGTVEHVGLKTTRLRSLSGEQLVFSNSDLLGSRIRNFKRMYERRVVFSVGVVYQTPRETVARIPDMFREVIEALPDVRFDRAHFKEFAAASLNFEIVYYVLGPDFNLYMDRQQAINLEIFRRFEEAGISFAYPTQTIFVTTEDGGPSVDPAGALPSGG